MSDKRPQGFSRVTVKQSGLKPLRWKAECVERRPLRLEGGKDCKVLPILTVKSDEEHPQDRESPHDSSTTKVERSQSFYVDGGGKIG